MCSGHTMCCVHEQAHTHTHGMVLEEEDEAGNHQAFSSERMLSLGTWGSAVEAQGWAFWKHGLSMPSTVAPGERQDQLQVSLWGVQGPAGWAASLHTHTHTHTSTPFHTHHTCFAHAYVFTGSHPHTLTHTLSCSHTSTLIHTHTHTRTLIFTHTAQSTGTAGRCVRAGDCRGGRDGAGKGKADFSGD